MSEKCKFHCFKNNLAMFLLLHQMRQMPSFPRVPVYDELKNKRPIGHDSLFFILNDKHMSARISPIHGKLERRLTHKTDRYFTGMRTVERVYCNRMYYKSQKGLPLETKNTQNHENRKRALIESLHMQHCSLRGYICPLAPV